MKKITYVGHLKRRMHEVESELAELAREYEPGSVSPQTEQSLLAIVSNLVDFEILFQRIRTSPGKPAGKIVTQINRLFAEIEDLLASYRRARTTAKVRERLVNHPSLVQHYRLAA